MTHELPIVHVPSGAVVCYCCHCGAYLFTLGATGELDCDQCGKTFVVVEASDKEQP